MTHKVAYSILTLLLALSLVLHFRAPDGCLKVVYKVDGEGTFYTHVGSAGLTELTRDDDNDGIYELHDYSVQLPGGMLATITILNPNDGTMPEGVGMRFGDLENQYRNVIVTMLDPDTSGVYNACSVSFLGGRDKNKVTHSDWNLDGRFDAQKLAGQEQWSVNYNGQWLPVLPDKPFDFPRFVTVMIGQIETKLLFRDGDFFPVD